MNTQEKIGEKIILAEAILWSFFPIVSSILVKALNPYISLGLSMLCASVFFAVILSFKKRWGELRIRSTWKSLIYISASVALFYVLIFVGLKYTSPGNAAIVGLMEVFFTMFLLGTITKKEQLNNFTIVGGMCMVLGAFLVIFQGSFRPNIGDIIILISCSVPPFMNHLTKQVRTVLSPHTILFVRNLSIGIFLTIFGFMYGSDFSNLTHTNTILLFMINGILLFGLSKIFWIEAMHRMSVSKTISLASIAPVFTLLFVFILFKTPPSIYQLLGLIPILIGIYLLTHQKSYTYTQKNPA